MTQATRTKNNPPLTPRILRLLREAALYVLGAIAIYLLISLWTYTTSDHVVVAPGLEHDRLQYRRPGRGLALGRAVQPVRLRGLSAARS